MCAHAVVVVDVEVEVDDEVLVVVHALVLLHLVPSCLHIRLLVMSQYKSPATALLGSDDAVLILPAKFKCVVIIIF